MEVVFTINGATYKVNQATVPFDTNLNTFIRNYAHLKGTKFMCLEGGCGVCIVNVKGIHPATKQRKSWAVNSCLMNVFSCHELDITTIEGVGNRIDGYHPIQRRLASLNGTQCGYCSPGMVMNMFSLMESKNDQVSMEEIENSFGGNICRCTGYRPIMDAFKSMANNADEKLVALCKDIEDIDKVCPKTGSPCAGLCHKNADSKLGLHLSFEENREWHKVYSVQDVMTILNKVGSKEYMLVAGNTAHGVYRRSMSISLFIDINDVEELHSHTIGDNIEIGANVSLTETMDILEKAATTNPNFEYCRHLMNHIDLVANVPVRNAGTIAGNLSIKHAHNEFPSDIFLILETIDAKLTILESIGKSSQMSLKDYLSCNINKKIITKVSLPQLEPSKKVFRSYKIMPRAQNAHAFVNAGFLIEFNDKRDQILNARICFGGIRPDFIHATTTEKLLIGKDLYKNETLQAVCNSLCSELDPDWILPDTSPEFRKNLAISLFYKFVLNICPRGKIKAAYRSGGQLLERPLSSGMQTFDTYKEKWPLTQPVTKLEALIQSSGEAQYTNDFPHQPGELWAAFVLATEALSTIEKIDPLEALKMKGVHSFYSAKDIPGKNNFMPLNIMFNVEPEEIFCSGKVLFNGQPVGIILADNLNLALYAASLVKIFYERTSWNSLTSYVSLPQSVKSFLNVSSKTTILPTLKDVIGANATDRFTDCTQKMTLRKNDNTNDSDYSDEDLGVRAAYKFSGHLEMGGQYHYTMEPQTCLCVPNDDGIHIYVATQWMDLINVAVSDALNIPENKITIEVKRLGGGYGVKISRPTQLACAAALACVKTNRPIRFVLNIETNMEAIGKRYACISNYDVEVDKKGKIQKLVNNYCEDYGCSLNEPIEFFITSFFPNCYDNKLWTLGGKAVKTDAPSHTWCRAPGTTEGIAMIENIMEHIALVTKEDPNDVREANFANNDMKKIFKDFLLSIDHKARLREVNAFNGSNRWIKRGLAVVPMQYIIHYFGSINAMVSIYHGDGSVAITHGGIEMGQGINTKVIQVAAHVLGIPINLVSVKPSNNFVAANSFLSGGSMTSEIVSYAVMKACDTLVERLKPIRMKMKDAKWSAIIQAAYDQFVDITSTYMYKVSDLTGYSIWGCCAAEMEVDLLTGNIQLRRVDILEDTGESMSPLVDVGQVEGAFVMGIGYWLTENLIYDRQDGKLLTNRTWTYKPPGAKDIPIDFRIKFLQKSSNPFGVLRSKATGEPAFCMSIVVIFALRYALNSARKDAGLKDEYFHLGAPTTTETILLSTGNIFNQYQLK